MTAVGPLAEVGSKPAARLPRPQERTRRALRHVSDVPSSEITIVSVVLGNLQRRSVGGRYEVFTGRIREYCLRSGRLAINSRNLG